METTERVLVRRKQGRIVAGVAGALADYTGTEAKWWRWGLSGFGALGLVGFFIVERLIGGRLSSYSTGSATWPRLGLLLLLFAGGLAEWVYLALWFLVPRADLPRPAGTRIADRFTGGQTRVGLAAMVFGAGLLGLWLELWGAVVLWASLLVGVGLAIFRRTDEPDPQAAAAAAIPPAGSAWDPAGPDASPGDAGAVPPTSRRRRERRPKRPRSKLGWLFLGLALATGGVLWMLDASGSAHLSGSQLLAAVVLVLGVGLLVGAFVGRAKWTVFLGLPLIPILVLASAIGMPLIGHYGEVSVTATRANVLKPSYLRTGGKMRFDLTPLPSGARPGPMRADLGVGQITVTTNPCVPVVITAHANLGTIQFWGPNGPYGVDTAGPNVSSVFHTTGVDPVRLDLHVGLGSIQVYENPLTKKGKAACTR